MSPEHDAVAEVLLRYAVAMDVSNLELLATCYTDDCRVEVSNRGLVATSRDAIVEGAAALLAAVDATYHVITNQIVEVDGDRARMSAYAQTSYFRRGSPSGDSLVVLGIYELELRRLADGWRASHVVLHELWSKGNLELGGQTNPGYEPAWLWLRDGARGDT